MTKEELQVLERLQGKRLDLNWSDNVRRINLLLKNADYLIKCAKALREIENHGCGVYGDSSCITQWISREDWCWSCIAREAVEDFQ